MHTIVAPSLFFRYCASRHTGNALHDKQRETDAEHAAWMLLCRRRRAAGALRALRARLALLHRWLVLSSLAPCTLPFSFFQEVATLVETPLNPG
jgi:hypothetical protein